ncbi:MAG: cytochrome c [Sulfuritalea sp.]|nr:cytochrome c [Sulfuritalea sp.]
MKTFHVLPMLAAIVAMFAGPSLGADNKDELKAGTKMSLGSESAKPHFKPTGKPVSAARGEAIFLDHCALCHGIYGKGDGPRSAFFVPEGQYIPDMTVAQVLAGRDKELIENIREGLHRLPEPSYVMPQFKYILSEEEIRSVLAYLKTLPSQSRKK